MTNYNPRDPMRNPNDPLRNPNDPLKNPSNTTREGSNTGNGVVIGFAIAFLVAVGGFYFYNHSDGARTADNSSVTRSPMTATPSTNRAPAPAAPTATPQSGPAPSTTR